VAVLATRTWASEGSLPPGTREPGPRIPDPPGTREPRPRLVGPPIREGSPSGGEEGGAVHRTLRGPLAVLVHGVTSSSRTWWRVGPALAERGYRVLAVDLRGHGASPRAVAGLSVADLAGDVAGTVEAVAAGSPDGAEPGVPVDLLVGHSLGALVALELVGRRPGFARRLVVEDPPGSASVDWAALAAGIEADTRKAVTDPGGLRRDLEAVNPAWPPGEAERRVADLADCDAQAIAAAVRPGVPLDLPALLAAAPLPVLLLLAEEALGSSLLGLDRKAAVEALPDGTTRVLPAGHSVHREALDAWLAALDAWLAES
jgi:pimeloyl-ACP methyl ester carboxylesterase